MKKIITTLITLAFATTQLCSMQAKPTTIADFADASTMQLTYQTFILSINCIGRQTIDQETYNALDTINLILSDSCTYSHNKNLISSGAEYINKDLLNQRTLGFKWLIETKLCKLYPSAKKIFLLNHARVHSPSNILKIHTVITILTLDENCLITNIQEFNRVSHSLTDPNELLDWYINQDMFAIETITEADTSKPLKRKFEISGLSNI